MFRRFLVGIVLGSFIGGCGQMSRVAPEPVKPATRPAESEPPLDLQTRDDLRLLNQLLDRHEVLQARVVADRLVGHVPDGTNGFAESLAELDRQLTDQDVEVADGYLWAHKPPADDSHWAAAIAKAKEHLQRQDKLSLANGYRRPSHPS